MTNIVQICKLPIDVWHHTSPNPNPFSNYNSNPNPTPNVTFNPEDLALSQEEETTETVHNGKLHGGLAYFWVQSSQW